MIGLGLRASGKFDSQKVAKPTEAAAFKNITHAAASTRMVARRSIRSGKKPGPVGKPPRTRGSRRFKTAILYAARRHPNAYAIVGPAYSKVGPAGREHEHGEKVRDFPLPKRPTMGPALAVIGPRMGRKWEGSIQS